MDNTYRIVLGSFIRCEGIFESVEDVNEETMERLLVQFLVELSYAVITSFAVYSIVLVLLCLTYKKRVVWYGEFLESLGGILWIIGLILWRSQLHTPDTYDIETLIKFSGVGLMILPRIIYIARKVIHG